MRAALLVALALVGCRPAVVPRLVTDVHYEAAACAGGGGYVVTVCDLRVHRFWWQDDALVDCWQGPIELYHPESALGR